MTTAAYGGLEHPPVWRLRGAFPHLRLSIACGLLASPTPSWRTIVRVADDADAFFFHGSVKVIKIDIGEQGGDYTSLRTTNVRFLPGSVLQPDFAMLPQVPSRLAAVSSCGFSGVSSAKAILPGQSAVLRSGVFVNLIVDHRDNLKLDHPGLTI